MKKSLMIKSTLLLLGLTTLGSLQLEANRDERTMRRWPAPLHSLPNEKKAPIIAAARNAIADAEDKVETYFNDLKKASTAPRRFWQAFTESNEERLERLHDLHEHMLNSWQTLHDLQGGLTEEEEKHREQLGLAQRAIAQAHDAYQENKSRKREQNVRKNEDNIHTFLTFLQQNADKPEELKKMEAEKGLKAVNSILSRTEGMPRTGAAGLTKGHIDDLVKHSDHHDRDELADFAASHAKRQALNTLLENAYFKSLGQHQLGLRMDWDEAAPNGVLEELKKKPAPAGARNTHP